MATFAAKAGKYDGRWFDEKFAKDKKRMMETKGGAIVGSKERRGHPRQMPGQTGHRQRRKQAGYEICPLLYDLTSLQRDANGRFGFSAKTTLGLAQALYEKHKVLTYPRTDSRALPEDYLGTVKDILSSLTKSRYSAFSPSRFSRQAGSSQTSAYSTMQKFLTILPSSRLRLRPKG